MPPPKATRLSPPELKPEVSTIAVPVTVSLKPLFDRANQEIPADIPRWGAEDKVWQYPTGELGLKWWYKRDRSKAIFLVSGNTLHFDIPGNFKGKLDDKEGPSGWFKLVQCGDGGNDDFKPELNVHVVSTFEAEDWYLRSTSKLVNDQVEVIGCKLSAKGIDANGHINDVVAPLVRAALKKIDNAIPAATDIRPRAEAAWSQLSQPISIGPDVWLVTNPNQIALMPFNGSGSVLSTGVFVVARPEIHFGTKPETTLTPLPKLSAVTPAKGFHVAVEITAPYEALTQRLRDPSEGIVGKSYPIDANRAFKVKDAEVYGLGDLAIARISLEGWKEGTIYLQGTPQIDKTGVLGIKNFDYTLETKDIFFKLVDELFHNRFRDQIHSLLKYDLKDKLAQEKRTLNSYLNRRLPGGLQLTGTVTDLRPAGIWAAPNGFSAQMIADGTEPVAEWPSVAV